MATKFKSKKKSSASNPSITSKLPSNKKPKLLKPTEEQPEQVVVDKKQKAKDEISEIFSAAKASKKRKSPQREEEAAQGGKRNKSKERTEKDSNRKMRNKNMPGSKGTNRDLNGDDEEVEKRPRRRTADGLAIYSAEELGFGKSNAGGTPLCPFNCDCCF